MGSRSSPCRSGDDRRLAYEIDHVKRGTYYLGVLRIEPQAVQGLRRDLEYSTEVLRYLLLQDDKLLERIEERKLLAEKRAKEQAHTGRRGAGAGRGERARRR
ncbi:MAG: hypothetical protein KatS3mg102_0525 [Planctomycetota bacterium]|nr:MAG: hypothetical protein KatS3mg102_0525 [Planctomycetota bacterium]